ncbi:MAG: dNTP triphosphohydrolase [Planctomycetales bacterium]|nr:dNTP triphosphohydrolase [Planctomycetales bacterium]
MRNRVGQAIQARESELLAPFAMHSADTVGRRHEEPPHPYRGPFQRDRDRIIHSAAFRRLSGKTQVFADELGDYHRTRLTHTLEVASIARTLARALRLNEDLVETLALAHDIGHPPFGHAGEDVLDECLANDGGFSHNNQALRIMELLESRYPAFPGLNLSHEVLEGQRSRVNKQSDLCPLLEVQIVDLADSIAYDTHDVDDALENQFLDPCELLEIPLWQEAATRMRDRHGSIEGDTLRRAILHELIDHQVRDLLAGAEVVLQEKQPATAQAACDGGLRLGPSREMADKKRELEDFLYLRVYRNPRVMESRLVAQQRLREMHERLAADPKRLPDKFLARVTADGPPRAAADYLAGMTDRYAYQQYQRLCSA